MAQQQIAMGLTWVRKRASGHSSSMSLVISIRAGTCLKPRKMPPGLRVSPTHWSTPYFRGIWISALKASIPPTMIMAMTKSAPVRASRLSVVAEKVQGSSCCSSMLSITFLTTSSRPASTSISMMCASCRD